MDTQYNFDETIDRKDFYATKWVEMTGGFGTNDLIPLWIADMDFRTAPPVLEAVNQFAAHGIFGYTYRPDSYYESIKKWVKNKFEWSVQTEEILFSPGVMCSMNFYIQALSDEGDSIVIQEPVYYPFRNKIEENHRKVLVNELVKENDRYVMDLKDLEVKFESHHPALFILCNPHNPVGRVWTVEELKDLGNLCIKYGVTMISDEIHADLVYKPHKHVPIASLSDAFYENTITLMAPSKTFNLAGLQTSYVICNFKYKAILQEALGKIDLKRNNCFSLVATEAAYSEGETWLSQLISYLETNVDFVLNYLNDHLPKIKIIKPEATYLLWLDFSEYGYDDETLSELMITKAKVALSKGNSFGEGGTHYLRMNIACPKSTLEKALVQIEKALRE